MLNFCQTYTTPIITLIGDDNNVPDLKPITDLVLQWGGMFLGAAAILTALVLAWSIVKNGFKLHNAKDGEEIKPIVTNLVLSIIGSILAASGGILLTVFSAMHLFS